jgi:hypothetical protein
MIKEEGGKFERTQRPVGHGGFHIGRIEYAGASFRYFYDCGGGKEGAVLIEKELKETSYYFGVISHFDSDHFAKLIHADVKYLFIPYMDELDIFMLTVFEFLRLGEFVNVAGLLEKARRKIIMVRHGPIDRNDGGVPPDLKPDGDEIGINGVDVHDTARSYTISDGETVTIATKDKPLAKIRFYNHHASDLTPLFLAELDNIFLKPPPPTGAAESASTIDEPAATTPVAIGSADASATPPATTPAASSVDTTAASLAVALGVTSSLDAVATAPATPPAASSAVAPRGMCSADAAAVASESAPPVEGSESAMLAPPAKPTKESKELELKDPEGKPYANRTAFLKGASNDPATVISKNAKVLKKIYENILKKRGETGVTASNLSSLAMYSCSVERHWYPRSVFTKPPINIGDRFVCDGWMLTGDLELIGGIWKNFHEHYFREIDACIVFNVPHHGSERAFDQDALSCINNGAIFIFPVRAGSVIHPAPRLKKMFKRNGIEKERQRKVTEKLESQFSLVRYLLPW